MVTDKQHSCIYRVIDHAEQNLGVLSFTFSLYNMIQITALIAVPRSINHVTKLFNGTYVPLDGQMDFSLEDYVISSWGKLLDPV